MTNSKGKSFRSLPSPSLGPRRHCPPAVREGGRPKPRRALRHLSFRAASRDRTRSEKKTPHSKCPVKRLSPARRALIFLHRQKTNSQAQAIGETAFVRSGTLKFFHGRGRIVKSAFKRRWHVVRFISDTSSSLYTAYSYKCASKTLAIFGSSHADQPILRSLQPQTAKLCGHLAHGRGGVPLRSPSAQAGCP